MNTNLIKYIKGLSLPYRGRCPNCGGDNTFSVSVENGIVLYYCFRASCKLKGRINHEISVDELRNNSTNLSISNSLLLHERRSRLQETKIYSTPHYFISPLQNSICYNYLHRNNLIDFYSKNVDRIKYDPKENRCVFILKHKGECYGAVGRALPVSASRWLVYSRISGCPYYFGSRVCDNYTICVEDCVSASVLNNYGYNSTAILGTNISDDTIKYLLEYDKLYLMLDDDATGTAIKLQKQLSIYRPTSIIPLKKDPKYLSKLELETIKKEYNLC